MPSPNHIPLPLDLQKSWAGFAFILIKTVPCPLFGGYCSSLVALSLHAPGYFAFIYPVKCRMYTPLCDLPACMSIVSCSSEKKDTLCGPITARQRWNRYMHGSYLSIYVFSKCGDEHLSFEKTHGMLVNNTASVGGKAHIQVGPDLNGNKTHGIECWRKTIVGRHHEQIGLQSILSPEQAGLGICWLMRV